MTKEWEDAILSGNADRVRALLESGCNINALDRYGQTAMMKAAHKGHTDVVELLVQRGAELNHTAKFGLSALMLAVIADHPDVVRILVAGGANTALRCNARGFAHAGTALEIAEQMHHTRCAEILRRSEQKPVS